MSSRITNAVSELCYWLHGVRRANGRDCYPRWRLHVNMNARPTVFIIYLFNKLSVHLHSSQRLCLHVETLIMLPWKCGDILSLVSGVEIEMYHLLRKLALAANQRFALACFKLETHSISMKTCLRERSTRYTYVINPLGSFCARIVL